MKEVAPLPGTFMLMGMMGFLISAMWVWHIDKSWAFAFCVVFGIMFISSFISMLKADPDDEIALDNLAFHYNDEDKKKFKKIKSMKKN